MDMAIFEARDERELLDYIHAHGMAVIVWNHTDNLDCSGCKNHEEHHGTETKENCVLHMSRQSAEIREEITEELVQMGFRQGQVGFNNIVEAMTLIALMPSGHPIRVTSEIYPEVADRQGTTVHNVERTIRNAIESVWRRSNLRTLMEMYPFPCDNMNGRPTNAEFLINMAGQFRRS